MKKKYVRACVVAAIGIFAISMGLAAATAFGPSFLAEFLKGPASGWAQAFGSVAAIGVAYWLGQDAHRQQLLRDERADATRSAAMVRAVGEFFRQAQAVDQVVALYCTQGIGPWNMVEALAQDVIEGARAVPLLSLPDAALVRHLALARQSAITYLHWSRSAPDGRVDPSIMRNSWGSFATDSIGHRQTAIDYCDTLEVRYRAVMARVSSG